MTVEELKTSPEYVTLTTQQQAFTLAFCTNGADKTGAAKTAYNAKDDQSALATANRNLRHPAIKGLVNRFYNRTDETGSKTEALAIIWKKIQDGCGGDPKMLLDYMKLYGEWKGFKPEKPVEDPKEDETDYAAALDALKE